MGGDSAGGGLTVTTARLAAEAGVPLPSKLLLICPWLDATASAPEQAAIEKRDSILSLSGIRDIGPVLANGLDVTDPLVSPINGTLPALPPTLMYGGGDDILVTDARTLKARMPGIDYREGAGLMHVWPIFPLPESRRAQAEIAGFVGSVQGMAG
jgi:acetyl esterase/lipase